MPGTGLTDFEIDELQLLGSAGLFDTYSFAGMGDCHGCKSETITQAESHECPQLAMRFASQTGKALDGTSVQ
jgi:hypothetical protein